MSLLALVMVTRMLSQFVEGTFEVGDFTAEVFIFVLGTHISLLNFFYGPLPLSSLNCQLSIMTLCESSRLFPEVTLEFVDLPEELLFFQSNAFLFHFQELYSFTVVALCLRVLVLPSL